MKTRTLIFCVVALASAIDDASAQATGKGGGGATKTTEVTGIVVSPPAGGAGPTIKWNSIDKATFQVQRSKAGDTCCDYSSPAGLTATSWQDAALPSSGVYVYRVTATLRTGQVFGATQYSYSVPGEGAGTAPAPAPTVAPAVSGRYRLTMTRVETVTPTADVLADGIGDEIYAAAVVIRADRATGAKLGTTIVKSKEYGDIGDSGIPFANRVRAGTASPSGGFNGGSEVGDPGTPGAETFPFVLWEGTLTDGGEAVVVIPSVWERDTADVVWRDYSANWMTAQAPLLASPLLMNQYNSNSLALVVPAPETGGIQQGITGPIYGSYYISLNWLSGVDRMIGMSSSTGANPTYSERIVVLTREKLAGMVVGGTTDVQVRVDENDNQRAIYSMILRVERIG